MSSGRIHRAPLLLVALIIAVVGVGGGAGVYLAADRRDDALARDQQVTEVLSSNTGPAENYLIVGSDSRENFDPEETGDEIGSRSDTIMILRRDPDEGASLLSIPRDLWVTVAGGYGERKINSAFGRGSDILVRTVQQELGIPIDHYVEIDFAGFITLVDAIGGVEVCVERLARDPNTGMELQPGCQMVDGAGGLSVARSRTYTEYYDGDNGDPPNGCSTPCWSPDELWDFGRIQRQQEFIRSAANALLAEVVRNPERVGDLVEVAAATMTVDVGADLFGIARALAAAAEDGIYTYTIPAERYLVSGQDALQMTDDAEPILAYFGGTGPRPSEDDAAGEVDPINGGGAATTEPTR